MCHFDSNGKETIFSKFWLLSLTIFYWILFILLTIILDILLPFHSNWPLLKSLPLSFKIFSLSITLFSLIKNKEKVTKHWKKANNQTRKISSICHLFLILIFVAQSPILFPSLFNGCRWWRKVKVYFFDQLFCCPPPLSISGTCIPPPHSSSTLELVLL